MRESNFPLNMYTVDKVNPLPYYVRDIVNPETSFEFDMNKTARIPNSRIPSRWGWNTGWSNGYGIPGLFDKNCPPGCIVQLEADPKGYVSKNTMDIYNRYWCKKY